MISPNSYSELFIIQGYLEFYIKTKNVRRAPFYILSIGNAILMIVVMVLHDLCDSNQKCSHTFTKVKGIRNIHVKLYRVLITSG